MTFTSIAESELIFWDKTFMYCIISRTTWIYSANYLHTEHCSRNVNMFILYVIRRYLSDTTICINSQWQDSVTNRVVIIIAALLLTQHVYFLFIVPLIIIFLQCEGYYLSFFASFSKYKNIFAFSVILLHRDGAHRWKSKRQCVTNIAQPLLLLLMSRWCKESWYWYSEPQNPPFRHHKGQTPRSKMIISSRTVLLMQRCE